LAGEAQSPRGVRAKSFRAAFAVALALAPLLCGPAIAVPPGADDPVTGMLARVERYLEQHEAGGVTMDPRYPSLPTEFIRQTVVCQVAGYYALYRVRRTYTVRDAIERHADFLVRNLDLSRSHTPFDGMLAYSLLVAYEVTGEPRFLDSGTIVMDELKAIPTGQCILNGGLMVAMATAEYWRLTGDAVANRKTLDILALLDPYQNPDGSFPHWCYGSEDMHYTGWMAEELILIQRMTGSPLIEPMLGRMARFMESRVDSSGTPHYEESCPDYPGCTRYYYSRASGCAIDYDTRGWTVEPAYTAMLFDHVHSPRYASVMRFLGSIENGGTYPDLWGYWPPPSDPEYQWTIADTSVANMSVIFWTLANVVAGRATRSGAMFVCGPEEQGLSVAAGIAPGPEPATAAPGARIGRVEPNPARDGCAIRFGTLRPMEASLEIFDAAGRRIRNLLSGALTAGDHEARWDLRDAAGRRCRGGCYYVRLRAAGQSSSTAMVVVP
jgi:flagellar hook capping protein FlgD